MVLPTINGELNFRRKLITIDGSKVTTETAIPLGLNVNLPGCRADAGDIRLAKLDGTPIAREIECKGVPTADDVMIWYPWNTTASQDDQFWVYWGNQNLTEPAAGSTYGSQAVWDTDIEGSWLLNNDPNGDVADSMKDSTSNARHLTPSGSMTTADLVDTSYGKAIDFDGGDKLTRASGDVGIANAFTVITKAVFDTDANLGIFELTPSANEVKMFRSATNDDVLCANRNSAGDYIKYFGSGTATISTATEYTIATTWDGTDMHIYVDGVQSTPYLKNVDGSGTMTNTNRVIAIGYGSTNYQNGLIYFTELHSSARSANYILTRHKNINNPTAAGTAPFYKSFGLSQHQRRHPQFQN